MTFDLADFLAPLDGWVLLMSLILGVGFGLAMRGVGILPARAHFFHLLTAGLVFYVPLAVIRAVQESPVWERLLATLILWALFAFGMELGIRLRR